MGLDLLLGFKTDLNVLCHSRLFELLGCLASVMLYEVVDNTLLEAEFDSDVFAKDDLTFKNVLIGEHQLNA